MSIALRFVCLFVWLFVCLFVCDLSDVSVINPPYQDTSLSRHLINPPYHDKQEKPKSPTIWPLRHQWDHGSQAFRLRTNGYKSMVVVVGSTTLVVVAVVVVAVVIPCMCAHCRGRGRGRRRRGGIPTNLTHFLSSFWIFMIELWISRQTVGMMYVCVIRWFMDNIIIWLTACMIGIIILWW